MNASLWKPPLDDLPLGSDHVDVFRIVLDPGADSVRSAESHLPEEEIARASRFRFDRDRGRYIMAHASLRMILARIVHSQPQQLKIATTEFGKPFLPGFDIEFNLSHSGNIALVAVSRRRRVGVDVERIREGMEVARLARRFFSPVESSELLALPAERRLPSFFECWTRKEAYIKAQGLGFSLPLNSFDVSFLLDEPAGIRATRPDPHEAARWMLVPLNVGTGYAAALAVEGTGLEFSCWDWTTV